MKEINIFEREVGGRRYRIASQSVWDSGRQRPFARQVVLGPADPPPVADLALVRTIGTQRVGDAGALVWVAEQLDLIGLIDRACGQKGPEDGPTIGEMVVAVAVQRACAPAAKCHLAAFLESPSLVPACIGLHRTGVSSVSRGGHRGATGEGADRDRPCGGGALRFIDVRSGVRHNQLRHAHCDHHCRRTGAPGPC